MDSSTAKAYVPEMNNNERETVLDWLETIDRRGPFAPLGELEALFAAAPAGATNHPEYHYLKGLLRGRSPDYSPPPGATVEQHMAAAGHIAKTGVGLGPEVREYCSGLLDGLMVRSGLLG